MATRASVSDFFEKQSLFPGLNYLPIWKLLKQAVILSEWGPLDCTCSLRSFPTEMRFHSKYSESASRFSCLQLPGAPVKNILLPIKIKIDGVNVDKSKGE